ncbi:uncharacterized protein [Dermacentor andersoni]|uniref:uncharacterized protein n=1 Tax=Dermacentor andersoni TaxID=34620 RepID=UPI003B3AC56D
MTAYHPQSNGLVERFHQHLKASLMAHESPEKWVLPLPLVLLGTIAALKSELGCSCAEVVHGTHLRLSCDFLVATTKTPTPSPADYVAELQAFFSQIRAVPARPQDARSPYASPALTSATHVFVRNCAVRKPLQPHYSGPYCVLERHPTIFVVHVNGRSDIIALERLKPAYLEAPAPTAPPVCDAILLHPSPPPPHVTPNTNAKTRRVTSTFHGSSNFPLL